MLRFYKLWMIWECSNFFPVNYGVLLLQALLENWPETQDSPDEDQDEHQSTDSIGTSVFLCLMSACLPAYFCFSLDSYTFFVLLFLVTGSDINVQVDNVS